MPEIKKRDILREPIKVVDQTAAASRRMKEALVKAKEKARENSQAKEESPEEYASDKITGSAETVFYSGMHLAQEAMRSRKKSAATRADRVEDTKAAQSHEQPRDQAMEAGRRAAAKSAKKSAEEKRAAESSVGVAESEASVLPEPLAPSNPEAPSPPGEAALRQPEKAEAKGKIPGHGKAEAHTKKSPEGPLSYEKKVLLSDGSTGQGARNIKNVARPPNEVIEQSNRAIQAGARATIQKAQKSAQAANKAAKDTAQATSRAAAAAAKAARVAIAEAKALSSAVMIGGGTAVFMILLVVLLGVSMALFGRKSSSSSYTPVSAEVEAYTTIITKYAKQYGIPEYVELIKAVMMQESGGQGNDPMQCSESGFNTQYPRTPGGITDPEYSIEVGVQTIADVLQMAGVDSPIDLDRISLALQGYNYGSGYISWALSNYGGYTELNAVEYSDMMAESYGWPGYGDKAYVAHVLRYYPIGRAFMGDGNTAIVAVAQTQLGNEGGLKYCEWYGYPYRVEWCVIFVSWCADQCGYAEKKLIQPFAFDVEAWREEQHTFVVDRDTVSALMRQNDDFCAVMQSRSYIYADGHVVRNDPRFVKAVRDQFVLTDWANAHVDECCLRFVRVYVQQNVGKYIFGRMYYDADYVKQTQFYLHDLINQEHLDELEAKYRYCRDFPISFRDAVDQLRKRKGLSQSSLSEQLSMDKATLLRWLDDPTKYRNEDFLTTLALVLELPDWLSRLLFKRAGFQLDDDNRRHQALAHILRVQSADGIEAANDFLKRNNQYPLSI